MCIEQVIKFVSGQLFIVLNRVNLNSKQYDYIDVFRFVCIQKFSWTEKRLKNGFKEKGSKYIFLSDAKYFRATLKCHEYSIE